MSEKPSSLDTISSPGDRLVDRVVDRALDPGGEHGHERDQRQPDHQRRRGRGGAAGVADRVLARQPAGHSAKPLERRADHRGHRRDQLRAEQRDAEQDRGGADPDPGLAGGQDRRTAPSQHHRQPGDAEHAPRRCCACGARSRWPRTAPSRSPVTGGDPRRAQRGKQRREHRQPGAEQQADDDRPGRDHRARCSGGRSRPRRTAPRSPARRRSRRAPRGSRRRARSRTPRSRPR